ncbi:hypothetical protein KIN34_06205 [Cellulomonas sp. DKR-3]|uniref:DUF4126 domain-containing protein n=1 Tax=Cellulomonas fulva TaxID=2835530 RepID=A0ABS5TXJ8_9CELL|nr:hypothetical protein [Cellulomonas fulva]MBT0993878.1 hypothetical protein [Cellulomonas fulva]
MGVILRSWWLGVAAGGRASTGLAVPVLVALRDRDGAAARLGRVVVGLAAAGELVGDKLPTTPSRLGQPQLLGRLAAGGVGAVALAAAERRPVGAWLPAAVLGTAGAFAGSVLGASWRAAAAERGLPDTRAALVEDATVTALAGRLVRTAR